MAELKKIDGVLLPEHNRSTFEWGPSDVYEMYYAAEVDVVIAEKDRQLKELYKKAGIAEAEVERLKKAIEKD